MMSLSPKKTPWYILKQLIIAGIKQKGATQNLDINQSGYSYLVWIFFKKFLGYLASRQGKDYTKQETELLKKATKYAIAYWLVKRAAIIKIKDIHEASNTF